TLSAVGAAFRQLSPEELREVELVFIDLDPERDTEENLKRYMSHFHPKFIAVRGDIEKIRAFAKLYGVTFQKVKVSSDLGYTIDHTTDLIVLGKDGLPKDYLPLSANSEKITLAIRKALAKEVAVTDVVMKMPPPGLPNSAGLMKIQNLSQKDMELVRAESPIADVTELHLMKKEEGLMKMRPVDGIIIKAGTELNMGSSGYHLMFLRLKKTLVKGERHPVTLIFKDGTKLELQGTVQ
ncbi:MAG: copper chaperone PCu(A)C, partial [Bacteriovoracaceae bacterium]